jgi:hypothetical protein
MGVSLTQITTTLNVFMGSEYVNDFDYNNRTYRVYVQADQPFRMNERDLHLLCALRHDQSDGAARQPGDRRKEAPARRSSRTTTSSARWRSMAPPRRATAPAKASRHGEAGQAAS